MISDLCVFFCTSLISVIAQRMREGDEQVIVVRNVYILYITVFDLTIMSNDENIVLIIY